VDAGGGDAQESINSPGTAPANGFACQVSVNGGPFRDGGFTDVFSSLDITPGGPGDTYDIQIAWCDNALGTLQSLWSTTKTLIMS